MYKSNLLDVIVAKKIVGGGSGSGGGDKVLNENGVIKQEHLPELFPYYKRVGVPETEITLTNGTATLQDPLPIVVGNTYSVGWNGSWYHNLVATGNDEMGDGSGVISKTLRVDGVFRIYCYPDAFISMGAPGAEITAYDGSETVTLEIVGTEITKMGEGLLPDSVNNAVKTLDEMIDDEGNIRYEYLPNDIPYKGKGYVLEPTDFTLDVLEDDKTIAYLPYRLQIEPLKYYDLYWNGRKHNLMAALAYAPTPNSDGETELAKGITYGTIPFKYYSVFSYSEETFEETGIGSCIISHRDNVTSAKVAVHGDIVKPIAEECLPDSAKVLNSDGIIKQENLPEGYPYVGEGYVLPEETFFEEDGQFFSMTAVNMAAGETYLVNWNGVDYECVASAYVTEGVNVGVAVGNIGAATGDTGTGEPFVVIAASPEVSAETGGIGIMAMPLDGSTTVTVSIKGKTIEPIDPKLLPEGYPYKTSSSIVLVPETDGEYSEDIGGFIFQPAAAIPPAGTECTVTYNGVDYVCAAFATQDGRVGLGNTSVINGPTTTDPFFVLIEETGVAAVPMDGAESITLKIVAILDDFETISEDFIPAGSAKPMVVREIGSSAGNAVLTDTSAREVYEAYKKGIDVVFDVFFNTDQHLILRLVGVEVEPFAGRIDIKFSLTVVEPYAAESYINITTYEAEKSYNVTDGPGDDDYKWLFSYHICKISANQIIGT